MKEVVRGVFADMFVGRKVILTDAGGSVVVVIVDEETVIGVHVRIEVIALEVTLAVGGHNPALLAT